MSPLTSPHSDGVELPSAIALSLAQRANTSIPPALTAGLARLFWERDLQSWERRACLRLLELNHPDAAANFIICGSHTYGHRPETAPLREAQRLSCLQGYFRQVEMDFPHTQTQGFGARAWLGLCAMLAVSLSPCSTENALARPASLIISASLLSLPALALAAAPMLGLGALGASSLTLAGAALAATGFKKMADSLINDHAGRDRVEAFPLAVRARASGFYSRLRKARAAPGWIQSLSRLRQEDGGYALLSASVRSTLSESEFEESMNWRNTSAMASVLEASELALRISAPEPQPRGRSLARGALALFSSLARRSGPADPKAESPQATPGAPRRPRL